LIPIYLGEFSESDWYIGASKLPGMVEGSSLAAKATSRKSLWDGC